MKLPQYHFMGNVMVFNWFLLMINISSPTSRCRKRNCLFKFDKSIVSISITSISPKPNNARFFKISQPSPPAPITKIRHCCCRTKNIDSGHENQCKVFEKSYCRQFVVQARNLDVPKTMFDSDMFSVYRNAFLIFTQNVILHQIPRIFIT